MFSFHLKYVLLFVAFVAGILMESRSDLTVQRDYTEANVDLVNVTENSSMEQFKSHLMSIDGSRKNNTAANEIVDRV